MDRYVIDTRNGEIAFELKNEETRRVAQNVQNLINTRMGEVPYDRLRGLDPAIFHLPLDRMREKLRVEIRRLMRYEPRASLASADVYAHQGRIYIRAEIDIG